MGQPRASRRKVIASDDEDEVSHAVASEGSDYEEPKKPKSGQLKRIDKSKKPSRSANGSSTQTASSQLSPPKATATKAKSKIATKNAPKANTKTIYSFFNSATQRQSSVQPTPSPQKDSTPTEQLEAIQDDSGDDILQAPLALSKDASTALSMRKRKLQHGPTEYDTAAASAPAQKFRKTNDSAPSFSTMNEDKRPWTEQFAPADLTELAVHKKKVADVRQWMELALGGRRQKVLVLKGAAGSGKTTTAKLLAADLGLEVLEWRNPGGSDSAAEGSVSAAAQFEEFIGRAGRANGLDLSSNGMPGDQLSATHSAAKPSSVKPKRQVLLVEEFPNTFSRTSTVLQSFRSSLLQYVSTSPLAEGTSTPIIMVISETLLSTNTAAADSFTAHRLLGPELVSHPFINTLEFNPVATTFLTKALETIVLKEARKSGRRKTPGPQVLKHIAESGDIRSAISSLEFLCLRGDSDDVWSSKVAFTKSKKAKSDVPLTASEIEALKLISNRENTLGIFHAVGKVMYNKRMEPSSTSALTQPPPWFPQHRRTKVSEVHVDPLIDELGTDTSTFIASLHENYPPSCSNTSSEESLESINGCIDSISDADLLSLDRFSFGTRAFSGSATDSIRQDEMAFQVAVRGILFDLPYPVQRSMSVGANKDLKTLRPDLPCRTHSSPVSSHTGETGTNPRRCLPVLIPKGRRSSYVSHTSMLPSHLPLCLPKWLVMLTVASKLAAVQHTLIAATVPITSIPWNLHTPSLASSIAAKQPWRRY